MPRCGLVAPSLAVLTAWGTSRNHFYLSQTSGFSNASTALVALSFLVPAFSPLATSPTCNHRTTLRSLARAVALAISSTAIRSTCLTTSHYRPDAHPPVSALPKPLSVDPRLTLFLDQHPAPRYTITTRGNTSNHAIQSSVKLCLGRCRPECQPRCERW